MLPPNIQSPEDIIFKQLTEIREMVDKNSKNIQNLSRQNDRLIKWGEDLQSKIFETINTALEIIDNRLSSSHLSQESQNLDENNHHQETVLESFPEFDDSV